MPLLVKDEIKDTLTDEVGRPSTVLQSRRLGIAAVLVMPRAAQRCPSAVMDSIRFDYTKP
jgi:hypothetical protein